PRRAGGPVNGATAAVGSGGRRIGGRGERPNLARDRPAPPNHYTRPRKSPAHQMDAEGNPAPLRVVKDGRWGRPPMRGQGECCVGGQVGSRLRCRVRATGYPTQARGTSQRVPQRGTWAGSSGAYHLFGEWDRKTARPCRHAWTLSPAGTTPAVFEEA